MEKKHSPGTYLDALRKKQDMQSLGTEMNKRGRGNHFTDMHVSGVT